MLALHSVQAPSTSWIPGPTDPGPTNSPAVTLGFHVQPDPPALGSSRGPGASLTGVPEEHPQSSASHHQNTVKTILQGSDSGEKGQVWMSQGHLARKGLCLSVHSRLSPPWTSTKPDVGQDSEGTGRGAQAGLSGFTGRCRDRGAAGGGLDRRM